MPSITLVIAIPDRAHRRTLVEQVGAAPDFEVISETYDLMTTYSEVEEKEPTAVLIAERLALQPEFEVMRALFTTLDIRWLVITDSSRRLREAPTNPWDRRSDLFAVDVGTGPARLLDDLRALTRTARRLPATARAADLARRPETPASGSASNHGFVVIGASTGGVDALLTVLSSFPQDCPPTFIVQHTGGGFGESLTRLLDQQCAAKVRMVSAADTVSPGEVVVAAGSRAHLMLAGGRPMRYELRQGDPISGHMPSVDALFYSAVPGARRAVAVLLTGMGRDGAEGLKALHDAGATTIAQDEATSIVYGMPRAAAQIGAAQSILPLNEIGPAILRASAAIRPTLPRNVSAT